MKRDLIFFAFFAAVAGVILYPWLFGGQILSNLDTTSLFYPFFDFYHKAIVGGESFLWNPLLFSGFPTYLSQSGGFLDPVNRIIFQFFGGVGGLHLRIFLDYFLVMLVSYLAGRAYGLSRLASSLIGIGYLSSIHIIYISNPILANTIFLTPFLLWVFHNSLMARWFKRVLWIAFGGIGLGWVLLSGNAQITVYILSLFGLFAAIYFFLVWEGKKDFRSAAFFLGILAAIVAVGFIVGLPQILASAKHTPFTVRASGLPYAITAGRNIGPRDFILFLFPNYLYFPYLSEGRYALYIGAFMFFMALSAAAAALAKLKLFFRGALGASENRVVEKILLFSGVALFALVAAFWRSPISYILQHLPVFKLFRYIDRWMFVGTFYMSMLGALGFDSLREYAQEKVIKKVFNAVGALIGGMVVLVFALNFLGNRFWDKAALFLYKVFSAAFYGRFGLTKDPAHYLDALNRGVAAWREFLSLGDYKFLLPFLVLIASFFAVFLFLRGRISWRIFRAGGFALSVIALVSIFSVYWHANSMPVSSLGLYGALVDKFIPKEDKVMYRAFPFMIQQGFAKFVAPGYKVKPEDEVAFAELKLATGWADMNFFSGMPSADGYDPFVPTRLRGALELIGSTHAGQDVTKNLTDAEILGWFSANLNVWSMMSGKYIISGVKLDNPSLNLLGVEKASRYNIPIYVYKNAGALPRFYYIRSAVSEPGKSLVDLIKEKKTDFKNVTYLDCQGCAEKTTSDNTSLPKLIAAKNGFLEIATKSQKEEWLVVSESYLPGWEAKLDGKDTGIILANGLYSAIKLKAGSHIVTLRYEGVIKESQWLRRIGFLPAQ